MLKLLLKGIYVLASLHVRDGALTYSPFDDINKKLRRIGEAAVLIWHLLLGLQTVLLQERTNTVNTGRPEGIFTLPTTLPCEASETTYTLQCMCLRALLD